MNDLQELLSAYGTAARDLDPHPDVYVYEGPMLNGDATKMCKVRYLMPLSEAEKALFGVKPSRPSGNKAVAPGFPEGLTLLDYPVKLPTFNRMTIMVDRAKPEPQVVCLELKDDRANWHPLHWRLIPRDWHTIDYVNTGNRGQPGIVIQTRVNDLRSSGGYIIANMAYGVPAPFPVAWVKVEYRPKETTSWYVPKPVINLILYCLSKQRGK